MNNPIAFKDPTGYLCEPGDCYSSGDSKDKDDLGVTLWVQNSFADNAAAGQARYDWMMLEWAPGFILRSTDNYRK